MRGMTQGMPLFVACLMTAAAAGAVRAEDKKTEAKPLERRSLDENIYQTLHGIINQGADMYNWGDWNGCYRLWEGALMSVRPLFDHRPTLQPIIDKALADARQDPKVWHRAFVLRKALDKIRADIDADYPHAKKKETNDKTPTPTPEPKKKTMWDRLGGEVGVARIVDDFVNRAVDNPKVDFFRQNKYKLDADHIVKLKHELVEQISEATGGPLKYTGPDMKKVHKGMGIKEAQFDALAADFKKTLEQHKVGADDIKKILNAVDAYRKEIVEPKKPEEKSPEEKKPTDKKPAEKKPTEKKPEEKKPAATASVTGKVTYKGNPASGAVITLSAKGKTASSKLAADGSFSLTIEPGEYKVTIAADPTQVKLPASYANIETTPLTCSVSTGKQNRDFDLK
jgi:hemoglobin